jgi:hypothetical protein
MIEDGLAPGVSAAVMSRDSADGSVTYLADVKPQWVRREAGYYDSALEILVLAGCLTIGGEKLARGAYSFLPAGVFHGPMSSDNGAEFFLMFHGAPKFVEAKADKAKARSNQVIRNLDLLLAPWDESRAYEGRPKNEIPAGLKVKYIRSDPDSGAYTILCYQPPFWRDRKLEVHNTWEELILLEGDYQMGLAGMVTGGTYIFRQGLIPHGPQATRFGSVWFGRGEKEINFDYQEVDWADGMIEKYLNSESVVSGGAAAQPWGSWRG